MSTNVLIMGAAGRDFHNFNLAFRDRPAVLRSDCGFGEPGLEPFVEDAFGLVTYDSRTRCFRLAEVC